MEMMLHARLVMVLVISSISRHVLNVEVLVMKRDLAEHAVDQDM